MARILVVHASDARPILEVLQSSFPQHSVLLFNVEEMLPAEKGSRLASALHEADVALLLASNLLLNKTGNLLQTKKFGDRSRGRRGNPIRFFQLNLEIFEPRERELWRRWFVAEYDPVFAGYPLSHITFDLLRSRLVDLASYLSELEGGNSRPPAMSMDFATHFRADRPQIFNTEIPDLRTVQLLFATNRVPVDGPSVGDFNGERSDRLRYGATSVRIPEDHKIGQLELPQTRNWLRLRLSNEPVSDKRHFVIKEISVVDQNSFTEAIASASTRAALVFVHGFNTSFNESVLRFAQIVWDLQFKGTPILFSWPSNGRVLDYWYDFNSALDARRWFSKLIRLCEEANVTTLHILAHSMGNFIALEGLKELLQTAGIPSLSEVVMAAPDVDVDVFRPLASALQPFARGLTLYASSRDRALIISRKFAKAPRAGDSFSDGPITLEKMESIDVSAIGDEMFGLNHNVFASNRSLIDDIGRLLSTGSRPPDCRSPQIRGAPEGSKPPKYWRYAY